MGYWIEKVNPGTFESIIYEKSIQRIEELNKIKDQVDGLIKINSDYKTIKKEVNILFNK